jgi:hypothetical protein
MINRLVFTQKSAAEHEYKGFDISSNEILLGTANKKLKKIKKLLLYYYYYYYLVMGKICMNKNKQILLTCNTT